MKGSKETLVSWAQKTVCPFCGRTNEIVGSGIPGRRPPRDGDFSMCIGCGEWGIFDSCVTGGMRKPTTAEYDHIAADKEMAWVRRAWVMAKKEEDDASA